MKKHVLATLAFYAKHEGWHSYSAHCARTICAVSHLAALGFLEHSPATNQARFTGKVFV